MSVIVLAPRSALAATHSHHQDGGEIVRINLMNPTAKFTSSHILSSDESILGGFIERDLTNPFNSLLATTKCGEHIRVKLSDDQALASYLEGVHLHWPSEQTRLQYAIDCVLRVCKHDNDDKWATQHDEKASAFVATKQQNLPFVPIGEILDTKVSLGCRYRSILLKCIGDASSNDAPLHVELRSFKSRLFNVVKINGVDHVVDWKHSPLKILPLNESAPSMKEEKDVLLPPRAISDVGPFSPIEMVKSCLEEKKASKEPTQDVLSQRFAKDMKLSYDDHIWDGFHISSERIVLDASNDTELSQTIVFARNLLKLYPGHEKRAIVLAKFVAMKLGGNVPATQAATTRAAGLAAMIAQVSAVKNNSNDLMVPIGRLISAQCGLPIHRIVLFKYLADLTIRSPNLWSGPIQCAITLNICNVLINDVPFTCEINSDPIKLINAKGEEMLESKEILPTDGVTLPIQSANKSSIPLLPSISPPLPTIPPRMGPTEGLPVIPKNVNDVINAMSNPLQPLNPQFGDGPSVEACDAAREQAFQKMGNIDKKMLVGEHVATCAMYIIHRPSGNVALVTRGLSDPSNDLPGTTGLGIEVMAEAKEADMGTGAILGASYLFQMLHEISGNCRQMGLKLRNLIDVHGLASMELNNVDAPPLYTDPHCNRTCVLLGIISASVPDSFMMPGNLKVRIVTARLLTFEECLVVRRFGAPGRKAIAALFLKDGTCHVSTIRAPPRPIHIDADSLEITPIPANGNLRAVRVPPCATEEFKWDTEKVKKRLFDLQTNARKQVQEEKANQSEASSDFLPPLNERSPITHLGVAAIFPQFTSHSPLANAMYRFDMRLRQMLIDANQNGAQSLAKHLTNALVTQTQLAGWKHVQDYIIDPKAYLERHKPVRSSDHVVRGGPEPTRPVDVLQRTGERLLQHLHQRLDWFLDLQSKANEEFDPDLFLQVLASDNKWMGETHEFIRDAEYKVTDLLKRNAQRFGAFRDLQKRGVQWPHSQRLRTDIESAGFVFKPMMVKRDRSVCEQCGVEIAGWRPWHNPWQMHNMSRHTNDFHERANRFGAAFPQSGLYTFNIVSSNATSTS